MSETTDKYMNELKEWLLETADQNLEEMSGFFTARIEGYEEHMSIWKKSYERFAKLLPQGCEKILDLGCGTGLELDEIYKIYPDISVTGVDLCQSMLDKLAKKYINPPKMICMDYFKYDMGIEKWDAIISFESLHHFLPEKKKMLYQTIYHALKQGTVFLLGDYVACCIEEEELLHKVYFEKRMKFQIPDEQFVHFDIPLTLKHEIELLYSVGFSDIQVCDHMEEAMIIIAKKK